MKRTPVQSQCLASVGYSPRRQVLEVEFVASGAVGQYSDVPASVYQELMATPSKGRYYGSHIRGHYPYQQTKAPKPRQARTPAPRIGGVEADLVAIAEYLCEQNDGQLPHAQELALAS